jgi:hypothetical protein
VLDRGERCPGPRSAASRCLVLAAVREKTRPREGRIGAEAVPTLGDRGMSGGGIRGGGHPCPNGSQGVPCRPPGTTARRLPHPAVRL